jgi:hypothetical protein
LLASLQYSSGMSTATRDKIIGYLGRGVSPLVTATSCGVTPAYVSQLLEEESVREEIALKRASLLEDALAADSTLERIEKAALKQVEAKMPFVRTAIEAVKIAATLNGMKRKAASTDQTSDALAAQQVTILLPRAASVNLKINENNQVIEVEGRTMAPLPSKALPSLQARLAPPAAVVDVKPLTPATVAHREKVAVADTQRAKGILRDLTLHMNGVQVVL